VRLAGLALLGEAGRAARGGCELGVAAPAAATAADDHALSRLDEVGDDAPVIGTANQSADGEADHHIGAVSAVLALAAAAAAGFGAVVVLTGEVNQGAKMGVGYDDHVPAVAAAAAVRPPSRDVLLVSKADDTVAAVASLHLDFRLVYEHCAVRNGRTQDA